MSTLMAIIYIMMLGDYECVCWMAVIAHYEHYCQYVPTVISYLLDIWKSINKSVSLFESVDQNLLIQLIPSKSSRKPGWHPQVKLPCVLMHSWLHWRGPNAHSFISDKEMVDKHLVAGVIINRETNYIYGIVVVFSYPHIPHPPWWNLVCIGRQSYQKCLHM